MNRILNDELIDNDEMVRKCWTIEYNELFIPFRLVQKILVRKNSNIIGKWGEKLHKLNVI